MPLKSRPDARKAFTSLPIAMTGALEHSPLVGRISSSQQADTTPYTYASRSRSATSADTAPFEISVRW